VCDSSRVLGRCLRDRRGLTSWRATIDAIQGQFQVAAIGFDTKVLAGPLIWSIPGRCVDVLLVVKVTLVSIGKRKPRATGDYAARGKRSGQVKDPQAQAASVSVPHTEVTPQSEASSPPLGPALQAHIGKQLRAAFQSVLAEPVPSRFVELLESLEKKGDG
jgi:Anti-sigma factor NepR